MSRERGGKEGSGEKKGKESWWGINKSENGGTGEKGHWGHTPL